MKDFLVLKHLTVTFRVAKGNIILLETVKVNLPELIQAVVRFDNLIQLCFNQKKTCECEQARLYNLDVPAFEKTQS